MGDGRGYGCQNQSHSEILSRTLHCILSWTSSAKSCPPVLRGGEMMILPCWKDAEVSRPSEEGRDDVPLVSNKRLSVMSPRDFYPPVSSKRLSVMSPRDYSATYAQNMHVLLMHEMCKCARTHLRTVRMCVCVFVDFTRMCTCACDEAAHDHTQRTHM